MKKENHLFRPIFLLSVLLLVFNDLFLKYEYHNYFTGKLSDFAGLFAFPYFLSNFMKRRINAIYILSGLFFIFWKSGLSQPTFDFAQSFGIGINRTVDYADLIALIILPLSYLYFTNKAFAPFPKSIYVFKPLVVGICIFSFIATTVSSHVGQIKMKSDIEVDLPFDINKAKDLNILHKREGEGKYIYRLYVPGKRATIATLIEIHKRENGITRIKLDSILSYHLEGSSPFASGIDDKDITYLDNLSRTQIEKLLPKTYKNNA